VTAKSLNFEVLFYQAEPLGGRLRLAETVTIDLKPMKDYQIYLHMIEFPPIVKRGQHVLILLQNAVGEFVLANKDIYPKGISRMVGGGMDAGEDPAVAAARELAEETGIEIKPKALTPLARIAAHITDATDDQLTFVTHLFYYNLGEHLVQPQDDIKSVTNLTEEKYFELLRRYEQLPRTINDKHGFAWFDYGQLYSFIHRLAINEFRHLK